MWRENENKKLPKWAIGEAFEISCHAGIPSMIDLANRQVLVLVIGP
jgi:hypothetical protein